MLTTVLCSLVLTGIVNVVGTKSAGGTKLGGGTKLPNETPAVKMTQLSPNGGRHIYNHG